MYSFFMCADKLTLTRIKSLQSSDRLDCFSTISALKNTQTPTIPRIQYCGKSKLDSHADTMVAGKNCIVMHYTDRTCTVSPYNDQEYKPVSGVPIVQAATGYTSKNGRNYILILNEALSMPTLNHSLWNPNQMRHYGADVIDNPYEKEPMRITSPDGEFTSCLQHQGTTIFVDTWTPTDADLKNCPHIVLTSPHPWNPQNVRFPSVSYSEQEEIERRSIKSIQVEYSHDNFSIQHHGEIGFCEPTEIDELPYEDDIIMNIGDINHQFIESITTSQIKIASVSKIITKLPIKKRKRIQFDLPTLEPGPIKEIDIQPRKTFLSNDRHSNMSPQDLSERWCISVAQAALTLKATTRRLIRSALMPLARRYRVDRMFMINRIRGEMSTDTMDARCKSIHGERYCQVFGNKDFFVEAYPIIKKGDCHAPLELLVPDNMRYDGSKEQCGKHTKFQGTIKKYGIHSRISEPHRSNQNPAEGVIRELRKKWFRTLFKTGCPRRLWSYGLPHIAKVMQHTASYAGNLEGRTPIEKLTGETPDISEYLDFGFYDWVVFKEDAGLSEVKIGRFLGVSHEVGSLMSYWVLPDTGVPQSRTSAQRLTLLEQGVEANLARMLLFTRKIEEKFKDDITVEKGTIPNMDEWSEFKDDEDFCNEFQRVFSHEDIQDEDDTFEPDSFDQYLNMELALERDGDTDPQIATVKKRLKNDDGDPIWGITHKSYP